MKRTLAILVMIATLAGFAVTSSSAGAIGGKQFMSATLTGSREVPAIQTDAFGKAFFVLDEESETIRFLIWGHDITGVTEAHVHVGGLAENGPPVVFLLNWNGNGVDPINGTGTVTDSFFASGVINEFDVDLINPSYSVEQLMDDMRGGGTYVNVHTKANPNGEIRGQIF